MPSVPFPHDDPNSWDTVELGGYAFPGVCRVEITTTDDLDIQKRKGGQGASVVYHGKSPAKIKVTCKIWETLQMGELQDIVKTLRPPARKVDPKPLSISHPQCAMFGVSSVVVESVSAKHPPEGGDMYEVEFSLVEFLDPPAVSASTATKKLSPRDQQLAAKVPTSPKPSTSNTQP